MENSINLKSFSTPGLLHQTLRDQPGHWISFACHERLCLVLHNVAIMTGVFYPLTCLRISLVAFSIRQDR